MKSKFYNIVFRIGFALVRVMLRLIFRTKDSNRLEQFSAELSHVCYDNDLDIHTCTGCLTDYEWASLWRSEKSKHNVETDSTRANSQGGKL